MIKYFFVSVFAVSLFSMAARAQERRVAEAVRINEPVKIDGVFDEPLWRKVNPVSEFIQHEPNPGKPSRFQSIVKMVYDDEAIYVAAILYDDSPDSILRELSLRDEIFEANTDIFGVQLIPFNDGQNSLDFKVSAANVQEDTRSTNNDGDNNWDAVWQSEVLITDSSWNVEMKIPFAAIRFPKDKKQVWGLNYWRQIRRYREWSSFNFVDKEKSGFLTQAGLLTGIENIKPLLRLAVYPYVSAYAEKYPENDGLSYSYNYGADLKYGINESFTLDMTLVPDFGQVQSDDEILNLSPFEVRYDENRQFFTEGTELFSKGRIFYSRRIGDTPVNYDAIEDSLKNGEEVVSNMAKTNLINASKISGRTKKGLGIGVFNALTARSFASIKDSSGNTREIETQPLTNYNIIVLDQLLKNNSYVSLINTNVSRKAYSANLTGFQTYLRNKANSYALFAKGIVSQKFQSNNPADLGYTYRLELQKTSGNFRWELRHSVESDTYDPNDLGFLRSNNEISYGAEVQYNIYEPFWRVNYWNNEFSVNYRSLYKPNSFSSFWMELHSNTTFNNYVSAGFNVWGVPVEVYDYYEPRVDGWKFTKKPKIGISTWVSTDYRKKFAIDMHGMFENTFQYNIRKYNLSIGPRFRFNEKFSLQYRSNIEGSLGDLGYATDYSDSNNSTIIIFGKRKLFTFTQVIKASYIFNNKSSLSFRMRHYWSRADYSNDYYRLNTNGYLDDFDYSENHDINYNSFNIDMVYTWYFAPGSELNLVWKNAIYQSGESIVTNYFDDLDLTFGTPAANNLSVKVLYYLDYHYLTKKS